MSYIIIFLTILYASLGSLTLDNFTTIGNQSNHFWYFFIWTICIATYFFCYTSKVFKHYYFTFAHQKMMSAYIYFACIFTPLIPYTETNPMLDDLHVFLAMSSAVCFLGVWLAFLWHLKQIYPQIAKLVEVPFWITIQSLIAFIFLFGRINSIIEIVLVVAITLLIEFLLKNNKKSFTK